MIYEKSLQGKPYLDIRPPLSTSINHRPFSSLKEFKRAASIAFTSSQIFVSEHAFLDDDLSQGQGLTGNDSWAGRWRKDVTITNFNGAFVINIRPLVINVESSSSTFWLLYSRLQLIIGFLLQLRGVIHSWQLLNIFSVRNPEVKMIWIHPMMIWWAILGLRVQFFCHFILSDALSRDNLLRELEGSHFSRIFGHLCARPHL